MFVELEYNNLITDFTSQKLIKKIKKSKNQKNTIQEVNNI